MSVPLKAPFAPNSDDPQTTLLALSDDEPQTTLKPLAVLLPQTTDDPQTTELPAMLAPHTTEDPHTTDVPHTTEDGETELLPVENVTLPVAGLYIAIGDRAAPVFRGVRSLLPSAAAKST
jgi:hypothetical protein